MGPCSPDASEAGPQALSITPDPQKMKPDSSSKERREESHSRDFFRWVIWTPHGGSLSQMPCQRESPGTKTSQQGFSGGREWV